MQLQLSRCWEFISFVQLQFWSFSDFVLHESLGGGYGQARLESVFHAHCYELSLQPNPQHFPQGTAV